MNECWVIIILFNGISFKEMNWNHWEINEAVQSNTSHTWFSWQHEHRSGDPRCISLFHTTLFGHLCPHCLVGYCELLMLSLIMYLNDTPYYWLKVEERALHRRTWILDPTRKQFFTRHLGGSEDTKILHFALPSLSHCPSLIQVTQEERKAMWLKCPAL